MTARQRKLKSTNSVRGAAGRSLILATTMLALPCVLCPCYAQEQAVHSSDAASTLTETRRSFAAALAKAEKDYRKGLAKAVGLASRIEVFHLEFDLDADEAREAVDRFGRVGDVDGEFAPSNPRFLVLPYGKKTQIYDAATLTKDSDDWHEVLGEIEESLRKVDKWTNALSHSPTHAVRVYDGNTLIFETSYCFMNDSFFIDYGRYSRWHDVKNNALSQVLHQVMPLPPAYKQRLRKRRGGTVNR